MNSVTNNDQAYRATVDSLSNASAAQEAPSEPNPGVQPDVQSQTDSHLEATRSNALSRQGDNNLAAMVQREQLAGKTQKSSGIPKQELDQLASALNSKGPAADGVKEGILSAYVENKPGQHQKIARCLQQLAASGSDEHSQAYQAMKKEMSELTAFDPSGQTQPLARSFYKEVANLKGPGSERVKADMAAAIQDNIEKAKSEPAGGKGTRAYAGIYTEELGKMLNSDAPGIFNTMEKDLGLRKEIPHMMDNLLNHKEGQKAIGQMVAGMAATTAKSLMQSADGNRDAAQRLGLFLGHVERGIENNTKTREEAIEKGANLLQFGLQAAERLSPGEAGEGFKKVQEGIEWLKKRDLAKVEDARHEVKSKMYDLVDSTFMAVADPYGNLSAGNGDPGKVQKFRDAERVYDEEYLQRRSDALTRESLR